MNDKILFDQGMIAAAFLHAVAIPEPEVTPEPVSGLEWRDALGTPEGWQVLDLVLRKSKAARDKIDWENAAKFLNQSLAAACQAKNLPWESPVTGDKLRRAARAAARSLAAPKHKGSSDPEKEQRREAKKLLDEHGWTVKPVPKRQTQTDPEVSAKSNSKRVVKPIPPNSASPLPGAVSRSESSVATQPPPAPPTTQQSAAGQSADQPETETVRPPDPDAAAQNLNECNSTKQSGGVAVATNEHTLMPAVTTVRTALTGEPEPRRGAEDRPPAQVSTAVGRATAKPEQTASATNITPALKTLAAASGGDVAPRETTKPAASQSSPQQSKEQRFYLSGGNYEYKDDIKKMAGRIYDGEKRQWYFTNSDHYEAAKKVLAKLKLEATRGGEMIGPTAPAKPGNVQGDKPSNA